ncbi:DNA-binding protein [Stenotrophomonas sp.]|uniref:DNA-binding protein n=1 Tax=Stenotrophomonas sp. TaxID=69392 RepID=UPI0028A9F854|nr:DNA-binding protein [Stenotrophomonas sp.]
MARGITELDVHHAADDILFSGERPTVERIRAHLGTGSPNTVVRHLESWWSTVGTRLRQQALDQGQPAVPTAVDVLAQRCWKMALDEAAAHVNASLAGQRAELEAWQEAMDHQRETEAQERKQLLLRVGEAESRANTLSASEDTLRDHVRQIQGQLEDMRSQRDGAHARNERLEDQLATVRTDSEQQARQHATERDGLLAHIRATEDRSLQEVGRARQALQQLQESTAAQSRVQQHEIADLQQARQVAEQVAAAAQRELSIQVALVNTYTSQLERLGDLPDQVRAALATAPKPGAKRTGKQGRAHTPGSK